MKNITKKAMTRTEMLVVFNDTQLSRNGDHEAIGAFIKFVEAYKDKITHIVANGDITDYELQSRFSKSPDMMGEASEEIEATKWIFQTISKLCPNAEKVMVDGNHDKRWENMISDQGMGIEEWIRTPDEMFEFEKLGWKHLRYGQGTFYKWHDRIFFHGSRASGSSNNAKAEMGDANMSTTTGHTNRNEFWQERDALGRVMTSFAHGGFSKDNLGFVKKANSGWNQGFGVYYWNELAGEYPYAILMQHGNPRFIFEGNTFEGEGFVIPTRKNGKTTLRK